MLLSFCLCFLTPMLSLLVSVAARVFELRANDAKLLDEVAAFALKDVKKTVDASLSDGSYIVNSNDMKYETKDKDLAKDFLSINQALNEVPQKMEEILSHLQTIETTLEDDLKSGTKDFAVLFNDDPKSILELKGMETSSHLTFFISTSMAEAAKYGVPFPGILAWNATEKNTLRLPWISSYPALSAAVLLPSFTKLTDGNLKLLQLLDQKLLYFIDFENKFEQNKKTFLSLANPISSSCKILYFPPEKVPALISIMNAKEEEYPLLISLTKEKKGIVRSVKPEGFAEAVDKLLKGEAEKLLFRAPIPEDNETRDVKILNTDTLESFYKDDSSDAIIVFVSPRCGFCKALEPVLKEFTTLLKSKSIKLRVGTYDVNDNEEHPSFSVTGVPALFFKKQGSSEVERIEKGQSVSNLLKFISTSGVSSKIDLSEYAEIIAKEEQKMNEQANKFNFDMGDLPDMEESNEEPLETNGEAQEEPRVDTDKSQDEPKAETDRDVL